MTATGAQPERAQHQKTGEQPEDTQAVFAAETQLAPDAYDHDPERRERIVKEVGPNLGQSWPRGENDAARFIAPESAGVPEKNGVQVNGDQRDKECDSPFRFSQNISHERSLNR